MSGKNPDFAIPPLPQEEWEYLLAFDKKMRADTGHGIIDIDAINKITAYHLARGRGDEVEPVPEQPAMVIHEPIVAEPAKEVPVETQELIDATCDGAVAEAVIREVVSEASSE